MIQFFESSKTDLFFKGFKDFTSGYLQSNTEDEITFLKKITNSLFNITEKELIYLKDTYSSQLQESSSIYIINLNSAYEVCEILSIANGILNNHAPLVASLKNDN